MITTKAIKSVSIWTKEFVTFKISWLKTFGLRLDDDDDYMIMFGARLKGFRSFAITIKV